MVSTAYAPHPVRAGITPGLLWAARAVLELAFVALLFAAFLPWLARNQANSMALGCAIILFIPGVFVWDILMSRMRTHIRFHVPGGMRKKAAPPGFIDFTVGAIQGAVLIWAMGSAATATQGMDEIETFVIAVALSGVGAAAIPVAARSAFRIARDNPSAEAARHIVLLCLRTAIPFMVALFIGWGLFPDRMAREGREVVASLVLVTIMVLSAPALMRLLGTPRPKPTPLPEGGPRPKNTIQINHVTSWRDSIHELGESAGDTVLSWANAAPALEARERAHRLGRVGIYVALALVAVLMLALLFS